jgi:hypothetical protein
LAIIAAEKGRKGAKALLSKAGRKGRRRENVPRDRDSRAARRKSRRFEADHQGASRPRLELTLARYLDNCQADNQAAIDALEADRQIASPGDFDAGSPQNSPQSAADSTNSQLAIPEKALN